LSGVEIIEAGGFAGVKLLGSSTANNFDFSGVTLVGITQIDLGSGNDSLVGTGNADTVIGGGGNDSISLGGGDDVVRYGNSSNGFDSVDGGSGANDRLVASANNATIGLEALTGIEAIDAAGFTGVKLVGSSNANAFDFSAVTLTGIVQIDAGSGNDTVVGSSADDVIVAGKGNDVLSAGGGNDLFKVATSAGTDVYDGGSGTDRIEASASNVTVTVTGANITGVEAISAAGFAGFKLVGTSAANTLDFSSLSLSGVTLISGGSGNDSITGSSAADFLDGGAGRDTLTGGSGADTFIFNSTSHSKGTSNIDRIVDFVQGQDRIDLSVIDASTALIGNDAFNFIGNAAFNNTAGQLRFDTSTLIGVTRILADTDGNSTVDMEIHLAGTYAIISADLIL
jgi:Ca2+-binding RTX toxin-like protein